MTSCLTIASTSSDICTIETHVSQARRSYMAVTVLCGIHKTVTAILCPLRSDDLVRDVTSCLSAASTSSDTCQFQLIVKI